MDKQIIFVTGYFGAPIPEEARRIASCKGCKLVDLDRMIEEKDGRRIARLCMMGGEHAYRNAEFEAVGELCSPDTDAAAGQAAGVGAEGGSASGAIPAAGIVAACGDGILYDEDTRGLILQHELVIAGEDMTVDELWENARQDESTYHAFMKFGSEEEKQAKFEDHYTRQRQLFETVRGEQARR